MRRRLGSMGSREQWMPLGNSALLAQTPGWRLSVRNTQGAVATACLRKLLDKPDPLPCLPTKADTLPFGRLWLHEIKHDGFGIVACKNGAQVKLYSRPGNDLTGRFPQMSRR
jgi:ATP-dependent DNA ligase